MPVLARHRQSSVPRLAAALAVLAGLLNLLSALLPAERYRLRLLAELVPGAVSRGATVAVAVYAFVWFAGIRWLTGYQSGEGSR